MKTKYFPNEFEDKWKEQWDKEGLYEFKMDEKKTKFYNLVELPYTSGDLHIGHWFAFAIPDVLARFKRMQGLNVFYPIGFDAFGLPAENAAMKRNIHPRDWTMKNMETMMKQFATMGTMIDWKHLVITCNKEFYRWNQWIFIKMFERGVAYRGKTMSNWCEVDQTVLADENVESGKCWRCGNPVVQKEIEQWFLKITDYADELIWPENPKVDWPESVRAGQNNWIGKSEGMLIDFNLVGPAGSVPPTSARSKLRAVGSPSSSATHNQKITVFTTRPDTIDGASFIVIAPEHPIVDSIESKEVKEYVNQAKKKLEQDRKIEAKDKTGVFSGLYATNPYTQKQIPIWIADYVLMGYGTGAVMGVPAADERDAEFAKKFNLPIVETSFKSTPNGTKKTNYHIHDWSISRQRYWGTPVPMVHCEACGIVPVPEKDLPVELPYDIDFTPQGKPPLATNKKWLNVSCPKCGGKAQRDPETLDTFFDSSWYFYRYLSPHYDEKPFETEVAKHMLPVDVYFGGAEHTLGHTLYARFFTRFFRDIGLVNFDEFAHKRIQHGTVLGPDGNRMSKSKGNVINPDDVVKEYGADVVRMYLCFMMPYDGVAPWSPTTIAGVYRFLKRVWDLFHSEFTEENDGEIVKKLHKTIAKVEQDIEETKMNTAIAAMMEFINIWEDSAKASTSKGITTSLTKENAKKFLQILAPFAPFTTEEIWRTVLGEKDSIHLASWPDFDKNALVEDIVTIPVQINGKVRATISVAANSDEDTVVKKALEEEKVKQYLTSEYKAIYIKNKILNIVVK